jgi:thiol peroxidase
MGLEERQAAIMFKGKPLTLIGPEIKPDDAAPDFSVLDSNLTEVEFKEFKQRACLISVVPSLDTPVCDMQTRKFNQEAANLPDEVVLLTISMDLPFAQRRFCSLAGIDRIKVFSDHREASFGKAYGILIKELRLLGRGIFIADEQGIIRYVEYVRELTDHPDYNAALAALRGIL